MKDSLKQFTRLRESLLKRQTALQAELTQISAALGAFGSVAPVPTTSIAHSGAKLPQNAGVGKRAENSMSLAEAVLTVTRRSLSRKPEILTAIGNWATSSRRSPLGCLNTFLLLEQGDQNYDGKFGPK